MPERDRYRLISGWRPEYAAAADQLTRQRTRLLALVGRRVAAGWTGWDPESGQWFHDIPLVLVFERGVQLELAWQKWEALSITWNTIDLTVPPRILGRPFQWRPSAPDAVAAIIGRAVTGLAAVENPYFSGDVDFTDGLPMHAPAGWVTSGLWIATGDAGLLVYNGEDANGLGSAPEYPHQEGFSRVTPLSIN